MPAVLPVSLRVLAMRELFRIPRFGRAMHTIGMMDREDASAAYREESRAASGPIAAAVISAVVASGPKDSDRDEPSTA